MEKGLNKLHVAAIGIGIVFGGLIAMFCIFAYFYIDPIIPPIYFLMVPISLIIVTALPIGVIAKSKKVYITQYIHTVAMT